MLKRDAKAILQFYPEDSAQAVLIAQAASRVGFSGGLLVDYPNSTKAKKYYLCLSFERSYKVPTALGTGIGIETVARQIRLILLFSSYFLRRVCLVIIFLTFAPRNNRGNKTKAKGGIKDRDWILRKKETMKRQGKTVKSDSKYSARRRPSGF